MMLDIFIYIGLLFLGLGIGWFANEFYKKRKINKAIYKAEDIIKQAEREADKKKNDILLKAKEERFRLRDNLEKEYHERQESLEDLDQKLQNAEKLLEERELLLNTKESKLENQEKEIDRLKEELKQKNEELAKTINLQNEKLENISQLSLEDAKKLLISNIERDTKLDAVKMSKSIIDQAKENAVKQAKHILTEAIEKIASDHTVETTISVVNLASEDIKGRIIGRDGRNIKTFETLTGVKAIVDDTPEAVVLSGFDPVKRETARLALEKLIKNGKINPQRVEEMIHKSEKEMEQLIWKAGTETVKDVNIDKVHPELIKILGRLRYRTSYGQNVLQHTKEVAFLTGAMAAELGFDAKLARRAGLLHDIGKAMSQDSESTHTQIGVELATKYKEHPVVINAIASHHEDEAANHPISILVSAADSISGSRPGARRETLEGYVRRIDSLEKLADSFQGVGKAYAISAGREIRVIVKPEKISDDEAFLLASDIAKKIQSDMEYPGHIKVTVMRETRSIQYV